MIGRSFICKKCRNFSELNAKNFSGNFLTVPRNRHKIEMISLSHDVNDHAYRKSKSILLRTDLANKLEGFTPTRMHLLGTFD